MRHDASIRIEQNITGRPHTKVTYHWGAQSFGGAGVYLSLGFGTEAERLDALDALAEATVILTERTRGDE